jgi:hypothetical protein
MTSDAGTGPATHVPLSLDVQRALEVGRPACSIERRVRWLLNDLRIPVRP